MKIKLDGKEVELKPLDLNDLILLEKRFGDLKQLKSGDPLTFEQARMLVWLLVRKSDKSFTEEKVGSLIIPTDKSFEELMQSISKGMVFGGGLNPSVGSK